MRRPWASGWAGLALWLSGAATAQELPAATVGPPPDPAAVVREKPREFLDSMADNALTPDRNQLYRKDGKRREVDLGPGVVASLDEGGDAFISSLRGTPAAAGSPGRVIGIRSRQSDHGFDLTYARSTLGRRAELGGSWRLRDDVDAYALVRENRGEVDDLPDTPSTRLRRRDNEMGLRWRGGDDTRSLWTHELALRRSTLAPDPPSTLAPRADANALLWRGRVASAAWPGFALQAQLARELGRTDGSDPTLGAKRADFGAEWEFAERWGWLPAGSLLAWREAPRLGLLGDDLAMTRPAAYRRSVSLTVPDGSGQGHAYAQLREHSLADPADAIGVMGWQRNWTPAPRWGLETRLEQAVPLAGPYPVRATQVGTRLSTSRFPQLSFSTGLDLVNANTTDSAYHEIKITQRLADDWLGAVRIGATRSQPHGDPLAGSTDYKGALAFGWREPRWRALHLLTRYTWAGRETDPGAPPPTQTDRRVRIWLGHAGHVLDAHQTLALRLSRRIEHDEGRLDGAGQALPRRTDFWLARWIWEQDREGDARWSLSAHLAGRRDSVEGPATGWGCELGYRVSSKVALTMGYNPRGFADNEISVEERPRRGWTLRLRFTIEGALARWLDAGRSDGTSRRAPPHDAASPFWAASLDHAQERSAAAF